MASSKVKFIIGASGGKTWIGYADSARILEMVFGDDDSLTSFKIELEGKSFRTIEDGDAGCTIAELILRLTDQENESVGAEGHSA